MLLLLSMIFDKSSLMRGIYFSYNSLRCKSNQREFYLLNHSAFFSTQTTSWKKRFSLFKHLFQNTYTQNNEVSLSTFRRTCHIFISFFFWKTDIIIKACCVCSMYFEQYFEDTTSFKPQQKMSIVTLQNFSRQNLSNSPVN